MPESIDVTLRLEPGTDIPSGAVVVDGSTHPFRGWLELLRCLEDARSAGTPQRDGGSAPQ